MNTSEIKLSVICPIYNEEKYIRECLNSILEQDFPKSDMEVLLVDGMSTDDTRNVVKEYAKEFSVFKLIDNPQKTVPYAMNYGIKEAKGDIVLRLDAHAEYPQNYFSKLVTALQKLEGAENVGGVCLTLPCNNSSVAVAIAECLSNKFGMGNSYFRIGAKEVRSVDTVPFGCFHRNLFDRIGFYDTDMIRNQDDELNGRIIKNGGKIFLLPDVEIKYFARDKISKVRKMFYQYGLYKPLGNKKLGAPATIRQFFPLCLVLGTVLGFVASFIWPVLWFPYFSVLLLYVAIGFVEGIKGCFKSSRISMIYLMPLIFANIHYSYGVGYIYGLYKVITHAHFAVNTNR